MDSEVQPAGDPAAGADAILDPATQAGIDAAPEQATLDIAVETGTDAILAGEPTAAVDLIPEPEPLTSHGPARVIAMVNQKGG
ncbi:MAG: hypothetical protein PHU75_07345, partial [Candidatus Nanopelagicales bacterium]|nr:hypothetical protein [Candidatus Nanopelagicales bacterium]